MACGKDHLHQSISFALEVDGTNQPGMLDALGVPDHYGLGSLTALTFTPMRILRGARFSEGLEASFAELDLDAPHGAQPKPIPIAPVNPDSVTRWGAAAGARMRILRGTHTLPHPYYCEGSGAGADETFHDLLRTSMARSVPATKTDTINGAPADANTLVMTTIGTFKVGDVIMHIGGGINQFRRVVDIDVASSTLKVSPAFTTTPSDGDTIYQCAVFYPYQGSDAPTGALRFRMEGREQVSAMCRLSALELSFTDEGIAQFTAEVAPQGVLRNDSAVTVEEAAAPSGLPAVREQAEHVMSDTLVGASAPAVEGVNDLSAAEWSARWEFRLSRCRDPKNVLGASNVKVLSSTCTLNVADESGTVEGMMLAEDERTLVFSAGPVGAGNGFAVILPAAHNRSASLPESGEDDKQIHNAEFAAGAYELDDTSEADGNCSNVKWALAFPLAS